ncbi:hypothetical protein BI364_06665 [Acidihalobacter yilgarnensis]|uniref:DUF202 domain-containing protein n=1 Tax=Acidihalobacter yilgarnensis TaxID=2819280 RepID=A0A1D8IMN9_9GAMM|nr:DUF202 domain-containing protein [Acidihalobacter yilgarnensis]AOU97681.1 hypothetical protein BI364_06665 [Acidihalobacter yilgarnensis]
MIERFRDHAANERTYLAWIRTAVALLAFGFVIEKFDLFMRYLAVAGNHPGNVSGAGHRAAGAGLALMITGLVMVAVASWGYLLNRRLIDSEAPEQYRTTVPNLVLATVVGVLGLFLVIYVGREVLG